MASGRTLHVRCTTWDQVEVFHTRKLRRGKLLSMKVPFHSDRGAAVTLNLELPNRVVIAIDGTVLKSSPVEADPKAAKTEAGKTWLEVELIGFTEEIVAQIRRMAAGLPPEPEAVPELAPEPTFPPPVARARRASTSQSAIPRGPESAAPSGPQSAAPSGPQSVTPSGPQSAAPSGPQSVTPSGPQSAAVSGPQGAVPTTLENRAPSGPQRAANDPPADERAVFQQLTAELRRLRTLAVHEVLGVARDADAEEIRLGWMGLMRRYHPDLVARRNAPAITHLAEELTILANRAYDRLRVALVAEGRATSVGPALTTPPGWLVGFDDISSTASSLRAKLAQTLPSGGNAPPVEPVLPPAPPAEGGEAFEQRARVMLGDGDADNAQEVLAAALCVYPRSRPLRSLYYVASAISALGKGEVMLATSQLETALAHHEACHEAAALLELLRRPNTPVADDEMKRLFR